MVAYSTRRFGRRPAVEHAARQEYELMPYGSIYQSRRNRYSEYTQLILQTAIQSFIINLPPFHRAQTRTTLPTSSS
jgi:hypothetical protein